MDDFVCRSLQFLGGEVYPEPGRIRGLKVHCMMTLSSLDSERARLCDQDDSRLGFTQDDTDGSAGPAALAVLLPTLVRQLNWLLLLQAPLSCAWPAPNSSKLGEGDQLRARLLFFVTGLSV
jgi:hypothetical protein